MNSSVKNKKPWSLTYHSFRDGEEEFWSAKFDGIDLEGDRFGVKVISMTSDDYEAIIDTEGTNYIKLGCIEMSNLYKCIKKAHKELLWLEEE